MKAKDFELLKRHYLIIHLPFGYKLRIWDSSPKKVLEHLKEITDEQRSKRQSRGVD